MAVARHAYTGGATSQGRTLTFPAGARIMVTQQGEPGAWWLGKYEGQRGWFPSSFCDMEEKKVAVRV